MSENERTRDNSQEVITLEGRVEILGDFPKEKLGDNAGVKHSGLVLQTKDRRILIHLGPADYFVQHNFQIKAGDTLKVTGTQMMLGEVPLMQATEVKNLRNRLKLRNKNGAPLWRFPARGRVNC